MKRLYEMFNSSYIKDVSRNSSMTGINQFNSSFRGPMSCYALSAGGSVSRG